MFEKYLTRRRFLNHGKLLLLFLLNSCSNSSKKISISLQSSFYPKSLKNTFPASWQQKNINFSKDDLERNNEQISNTDFILINDGWINRINFESFQDINNLFPNNKFNNRAKDFLKNFKESQRNKLFPIGIIPYAVIIKNNKDLIHNTSKSWDFLLSEKLKGKIIFPQSPRIIMSISKKINAKDSLSKLKSQAMLFDDKNSMNWLLNSEAIIAIIPYSQCVKYLKVDSRLSIVFPNEGVPLIWNFLLSKSKIYDQILIDWLRSLEKMTTIDQLANQGWYLPFNNKYSHTKYDINNLNRNFAPSKLCWKNSWSLSPINNKDKFNLENLWNQSSTP